MTCLSSSVAYLSIKVTEFELLSFIYHVFCFSTSPVTDVANMWTLESQHPIYKECTGKEMQSPDSCFSFLPFLKFTSCLNFQPILLIAAGSSSPVHTFRIQFIYTNIYQALVMCKEPSLLLRRMAASYVQHTTLWSGVYCFSCFIKKLKPLGMISLSLLTI